MNAPHPYSGVRALEDGAIELTCPSCGRRQQLTSERARGERITVCANELCSFEQQVNWLAYLDANAVRK